MLFKNKKSSAVFFAISVVTFSFSYISSAYTIPTPQQCSTITFTKKLYQGVTDGDVLCLQVILNKNSATQIAVSGFGSPGHETIYFGPATKKAVIKFQQENSISAIGAVGPQTRAKLNSLVIALKIQSAVPVVAPQSSAQPIAGGSQNNTKITSPFLLYGGHGGGHSSSSSSSSGGSIAPTCGDRKCETGETPQTCPADCGAGQIIATWPVYLDAFSDDDWNRYLTYAPELKSLGVTNQGVTIYYLQSAYDVTSSELGNKGVDVIQNRVKQLRDLGINFAIERDGSAENYPGHEEIRVGLDPQDNSNGLNEKLFDTDWSWLKDDPRLGLYGYIFLDPSYNGVIWNHSLENMGKVLDVINITSNDLVYYDFEVWEPPAYLASTWPDIKNIIKESVRCGANPTSNPSQDENIANNNYIYNWKQRGLDLKNIVKNKSPNSLVIFYGEYPQSFLDSSAPADYMPPGTGDALDPVFYDLLSNFDEFSNRVKAEPNWNGAMATVSFSYKGNGVFGTVDPAVFQKAGYILKQAGFSGVYEWPGVTNPVNGGLQSDDFLNYYGQCMQALKKGFIDGVDPGNISAGNNNLSKKDFLASVFSAMQGILSDLKGLINSFNF